MQIARQVYGIVTAENGLCFTKDGQTVYITKRFDTLPNGTKVEMEDCIYMGMTSDWTEAYHLTLRRATYMTEQGIRAAWTLNGLAHK